MRGCVKVLPCLVGRIKIMFQKVSKVFLPRLAEGNLISFEGKNKLHPQKGSARVIGLLITIPPISHSAIGSWIFCLQFRFIKAKTDFTDLKAEFEKRLREDLLEILNHKLFKSDIQFYFLMPYKN